MNVISGIVGSSSGGVVEECYHIGDITCADGKSIAGIVFGTNLNLIIRNCYNIGNLKGGRQTGGISGHSGANCFNCYSIGKITSTYCGGSIIGMNYGAHLVHCFGRQGDFGSLSSYNNKGYGHKENAQINYECGTLTDEEFKTQDFVDELNILMEADANGVVTTKPEQGVWKMDTEGINGGYPIFVWQEETEENTDQ